MVDNLKNKKWSAFTIDKLFKIEKVKGLPTENYKMGRIPYISTATLNNGLIAFISTNGNDISKKNCISVDPIRGISFYQPFNFVGRGFSGASINLLYNNKINRYNALFICKAIEKTSKTKASYGYLFNSERLSKAKIFLPITNKGEPDYKFMEEYIKEREEKLKKQYKEHIRNRIADLKKNINKKIAWDNFAIADIFNIKSGKRLTKADMKVGNIPFVSAADNNNGVTNFISNTNESLDSNVLGVNYDGNGGMVISFYHPYNCIFSDSVKRFHYKNTEDNKYVFLFAKTSILKQRDKYRYGYKFNETRMKKQQIMLPVNEKGEPDYKFMEDYMKYLEQKKLLEYLDYIK